MIVDAIRCGGCRAGRAVARRFDGGATAAKGAVNGLPIGGGAPRALFLTRRRVVANAQFSPSGKLVAFVGQSRAAMEARALCRASGRLRSPHARDGGSSFRLVAARDQSRLAAALALKTFDCT
jgi:hypothetical protein